MAARDRVGATQTIGERCENYSRTVSGITGSVRGNGVDNARPRPVRGQGISTTADCSRTDYCHGQQHVVFVGVVRPSSGQYADTLCYFTRSCGGRLTGNCRLPPAVGGEQRGATSPSSAQPRTAALDRCSFGARQTRRAERECSVRPAGSARITSTSEWQRFRRGCVQCCGSFKPV